MKRIALLGYLFSVVLLFLSAGGVKALTIPASEDTYTATGGKLSLATNNASNLVVDASRKSFLYFKLSDYNIHPDATLRFAKLRLFLPLVRTRGSGLGVHVVKGEWNESRASLREPEIISGTIGVVRPEDMASRRFVTVDVTSTVQGWIKGTQPNEGFAIAPISGGTATAVVLASKEGPVLGLPAELEIEFQQFDETQLSFIRSYFAPAITSQPTKPSEGLLSVQAQGLGTLAYQWQRDGVPIPGATSSQFATAGVQSGEYSVVVSNGFTSVTSAAVLVASPSGISVDLSRHFNGGTPADSFAQIATSQGTFTLELFRDTAPESVNNFLAYLKSGSYQNAIFHRSVPGFIVQTGGFKVGGDLPAIPTNSPVINEFSRSNLRGTVAMAKLGGDPNSATNQWFVNLADNSGNLDFQNGGFTVFAAVVDPGMAVWDAIAALPRFNLGSPFDNLPLQNVAQDQQGLLLSNLVSITGATASPFYAASSNSQAFSAVIEGTQLRVSPGVQSASGAVITVFTKDWLGKLSQITFQAYPQ